MASCSRWASSFLACSPPGGCSSPPPSSAPAAADPAATADDLARRLLGQPLAPETRTALLTALADSGAPAEDLPALLTAGLLASPAFQWR